MAKKSAKKAAKKVSGKTAKKAIRKPVAAAKKKSSRTRKSPQSRSNGHVNGKMDPVVHFEIPMENPVRISEFYNKAFGWNTIQLGEEHGGYILAQSGETTKDGMLKKKAMINGGFYHKDMKRPAQYPTLVIAVDDLDQAVKKIEKAGGKIVGNPIPIPGYGTYISFVDTEGNRLEVIEPEPQMKKRNR